MSNPLDVCILVAGKGTRMGQTSESINKALLPIQGKAAISHIIEKFPAEARFVIGLGHLGSQVLNYLSIAHPNREFAYVEIDNVDAIGAGPGYSLECCRSELPGAFYFVSCDTLWRDELDFNLDHDWVGVSEISAVDSEKYCNFLINENKVVGIRDKQRVDDRGSASAFTGLCFIKNHEAFWRGLSYGTLVNGERQISSGLREIIQVGDLFALNVDWIDIGDEEKYKNLVSLYENFDFSKTDEILYITDKMVTKLFVDPDIASRRVQKAALNPEVFPPIKNHVGQFYSYGFVEGRTLYECASPTLFKNLLHWLSEKLWLPVEVDKDAMERSCKEFYRKKTSARMDAYLQKYSGISPTLINGKKIESVEKLLAKVPWSDLYKGIPVFFHGDLQFDNILFNGNDSKFTLLDWRQDFDGHVQFGDLYYDLAKLRGGLILNYDYIKRNLLVYEEDEIEINFEFASRYGYRHYEKILDKFIEDKRLDPQRVKVLTGLIYLNMSPLHHYPFDKLLHAFARVQLHEALNSI